MNGIISNSILKFLKVKDEMKTCNNGLQFLGREANHYEPKPCMKEKICDNGLITNDNCPLKERLKMRSHPNPYIEEVGNERKEEEIQSQHLKEENQNSNSQKKKSKAQNQIPKEKINTLNPKTPLQCPQTLYK